MKQISSFREALEGKEFLTVAGLIPPKGINIDKYKEAIDSLKGRVDGIVVPDSKSSMIHPGGLACALLIIEAGIEPIMTVSCRDRNRISICSDLLGAYVHGVRSILCVTGDYLHFGDAVDSRAVYDLDSAQAILMIKDMSKGVDAGGNQLEGSPEFFVGCVSNPQAHPMEVHMLKLEKKLRAGADFIITLDIFDFEKSLPFFEAMKKKGVNVIAGVRPVTMEDIELQKNGILPGNPIPDSLIKRLDGIEETERFLSESVDMAVKTIKMIKDSGLLRGVHISSGRYYHLIPEIVEKAGL